jgi:general secretion pathway protein D
VWIYRAAVAALVILPAGCAPLSQSGGPLDVLNQQSPRSPTSYASEHEGISSREHNEAFGGIEQKGTGAFLAEQGRGGAVINEVSKAPTKSGEEGVAINLLNAPLAQAAKTILGDILQVNYAIADKAAANITIQTSAPMQKSAVIDVFENALKVNGLVLVRGNGGYRIVQDAQSARANAMVSVSDRNDGPGVQVTVISLKYVSPTEMRRIIEPVVPSGGLLSADDNRNLLVLAGTASEMTDIRRLIDRFDVDWMKGMSFAFYPVKSSDPDALASELETVMGLNKDGPMRGSVRIIPNRRLGSIMVIATRPSHLDTARSWIAKLDRVAESTEVQFFVYKARNRGARELANVVTNMLASKASEISGGVSPRFSRVTETVEPATATRTAGATNTQIAVTSPGGVTIGGQTGGGSAEVLPGGGASLSDQQQSPPHSSDIEDESQSSSPRRDSTFMKVVADEPNSSILINATRKEYERIVRILERIDVLPTQVMIEALIAEVTLTDELKFGVKWAFTNGRGHAAAGGGKGITLSDNEDGTVIPNFPGFSYFYLVKNISGAIDALSSITKVKVVSAPSLTVLDNRRATLQVGDQVPITTQTSQLLQTQGGGNPAITVNQVVMKDTGIILGFSPHVSSSGRVVLDIEQEVSSATNTTTSGIDSPTIQQRRVKTTVVVGDGQVVALGGLIQENDSINKSQVPILGNIPVIGPAFRQKDDKINRTELLIFVRPQVLRDSNAAGEVADEFIERMDKQPLASTNGRDIYDRDARRILR